MGSHPGYGCWLSGIDVSTQMLNQNFQDPFVAIVVDPIRTISAGKVNLGAFRTYPKGYKPPDDNASEYQTIPLNKIEDFGVHCKQYYRCHCRQFLCRECNFQIQHGCDLFQVCPGQVPVGLLVEPLLGEHLVLVILADECRVHHWPDK